MDVILFKISLKKIKFLLVFFCVLYFIACNIKSSTANVDLLYKDEKAISVLFTAKANTNQLQVFLKRDSTTPVLGDLFSNGSRHTFSPAVPFTYGESYEIKNSGKLLAEFVIKPLTAKKKPLINAIYPSKDTVPENLLKMYFVFTEPMQEVGNILDFITVIDNVEGNQENIFLALPSHLWNKEHTRLTLWLDPGRIKTDLIPNKNEGLPINEGHSYTLKIDKNLKSARGVALGQSYSKKFFVSTGDRKKPNILQWSVNSPIKDSVDALEIDFKEPMDAILAKEALLIRTSNNEVLKGRYALEENEQKLFFYPKKAWPTGVYEIEVLSILEDLAGNNLNHLFDNNLKNSSEKEKSTRFKKLKFTIK